MLGKWQAGEPCSLVGCVTVRASGGGCFFPASGAALTVRASGGGGFLPESGAARRVLGGRAAGPVRATVDGGR